MSNNLTYTLFTRNSPINARTPFVYTEEIKTFTVYGKSFYNITNVYLSGDVFSETTFFNPFSSVPNLSGKFPGFTAVKLPITSFETNNDNRITFTTVSANSPGFIDVIVENEAGYGALTQYIVKIPNSTYIKPWSKGIKVFEPNLQLITIDEEDILTISGEPMLSI
jgi:hypothetical protein